MLNKHVSSLFYISNIENGAAGKRSGQVVREAIRCTGNVAIRKGEGTGKNNKYHL